MFGVVIVIIVISIIIAILLITFLKPKNNNVDDIEKEIRDKQLDVEADEMIKNYYAKFKK